MVQSVDDLSSKASFKKWGNIKASSSLISEPDWKEMNGEI
jgi:hypothetical protein